MIPRLSKPLATALIVLSFSVIACSQPADPQAIEITEISNPASSGARYPFATESGGTAVMSWLEPDGHDETGTMNLLWSAYDGTAWSEPELIQQSDEFFVNWADFPSIAALDGGSMAAHWLQRAEGGVYAYHVNMSVRSGSGSWSEPVVPHQDQSATEHGFVSLVPLGNDRILAMWLDGYRTQGAGHGESHDVSANHDSGLDHSMTLHSAIIGGDGAQGQEWEIDDSVCDCCQTAAARSGNNIVVVYRNRDALENRDHYYAVFDLESRTWSKPTALSYEGWIIEGCPVNGPQIAAHGDTMIATWFSAANDQPRTYMAVSRNSGLEFEEPILIKEGATLGRTGIAFNTTGVAMLTWIAAEEGNASVEGLFWHEDHLTDPFVLAGINQTRASGFPRSAGVGKDFLLTFTDPEPSYSIKTLLVRPNF